MKIKNILISIIFLIVSAHGLQSQVLLKGSVETGAPGETVCVKINMDGISELISAQFVLETDTNLLAFRAVQNFNLPGLSEDNFHESAPGILRFAWVDPSTFGTPILGSDALFEVCYEIVSTELTTANVWFAEIQDVLEIEIVSSAFDIFTLEEVNIESGKIIINNGNTPNFAIRIDHRSGFAGSNVCVDVIAEEVLNVISQQYSILYDPDIISFTNINSGAMEIPPSMYNGSIGSGLITIAWNDMNLIPLFLEPNEMMYQLCFDLVGNEGETAPLEFDYSTNQVEIGDANLNSLNPLLTPGSISIDPSSGISDILKVNVFSENGFSHNEDELSISLNGEELIQESNQQYISAVNAVESGSNILTFYQAVAFGDSYNNFSTLDLVLGLKMILNQISFDPLAAISLDIDESGGINLNDFSIMRKAILQEPGIQIQPYFYVEEKLTFPASIDIYDFGNFHEYIFDGDALSDYHLNFTAYNKGQASSYLFQSNDIEDRAPAVLSFDDVYIEKGTPSIIELTLEEGSQNFHALKVGLVLEGGKISIHPESITNELSYYQPSDEKLHFLHASTVASDDFSIKIIVETNSSGHAANLIKQASYLESELVYEDHSMVAVELEGKTTNTQEQVKLEVMPNPFFENLRIKIPTAYMDGQLYIYSTEGKEILSREIVSNEIMLDRSVLGPDAIYYVRVTNSTSNETIKLISKTIK